MISEKLLLSSYKLFNLLRFWMCGYNRYGGCVDRFGFGCVNRYEKLFFLFQTPVISTFHYINKLNTDLNYREDRWGYFRADDTGGRVGTCPLPHFFEKQTFKIFIGSIYLHVCKISLVKFDWTCHMTSGLGLEWKFNKEYNDYVLTMKSASNTRKPKRASGIERVKKHVRHFNLLYRRQTFPTLTIQHILEKM